MFSEVRGNEYEKAAKNRHCELAAAIIHVGRTKRYIPRV